MSKHGYRDRHGNDTSDSARQACARPTTNLRDRLVRDDQEEESRPPGHGNGSSLAVGAKTVAGIGIGLVTVIAGAMVVGALAETVLVPSLLLKLAGGVAGGGVGMAKGLRDASKDKGR